MPPLTTIEQPIRQMGSAVLGMLVGLLEKRRPDAVHLTLPTHLIERGTCAPPAPTA